MHSTEAARLRRLVRDHLTGLGFVDDPAGGMVMPPAADKDTIRRACADAVDRMRSTSPMRQAIDRAEDCLHHFRDGADIDPAAIDPVLVPVTGADREMRRLLLVAAATVSVPFCVDAVGRCILHLVLDRGHGHGVIGLVGLSDASLGQADRDHHIGWTRSRQVSAPMFNAHALIAAPPYSRLLRMWTLRDITLAIGWPGDLSCHGIRRQVFFGQLASNARELLCTGQGEPDWSTLLTVEEVAAQARERWIIPRSERIRDWQDWDHRGILDLIGRGDARVGDQMRLW